MPATAERFRTALRSWAGRVVDEWGDELAEAMRPEAPLGTPSPTQTRPPGELRASIRSVRRSHLGGTAFRTTVEAPVIQAATTDKGARPHVIRPVRATRLRFYSPKAGAIVWARQVNHPGNAPAPWWQEGLRRQAQPTLSRAARRVRF
jgi:hypothetical protein